MSRIEFAVADEITAAKLNTNIIAGNYNAGATINGATLPVPVYILAADGEAYATLASDSAKINFVGFAITNSTDGNPITIQTTGIVKGFTGLTKGARYYLSDTLGLISTTAGTNKVMVGVAISATEIAINQEAISQDSQYMKLTTDQSVAGIKTFSSIPVLPASDPTTDNQAVRKAYVDALIVTSGELTVGDTPYTIYYRKRGKFYFAFGVTASGQPYSVYGDAASADRIASVLGKTIATYIYSSTNVYNWSYFKYSSGWSSGGGAGSNNPMLYGFVTTS